jgi:hypothetical protein
MVLQVIRSGLGPLPFVKDKDEKAGDDRDEPEEAPAPAPAPASNRPAVLPDGSYATQVCVSFTALCEARPIQPGQKHGQQSRATTSVTKPMACAALPHHACPLLS